MSSPLNHSQSVNDYHTYHSRGLHTLTVDPILYKTNRDRLVRALKNSKTLENKRNPIVLLSGGESTYRYCTDHEPLFRQESYFIWTFGVREPDFYGAINVETGKSYLFAPKLPEVYAVWMGNLRTLDDFKVHYQVDEAFWVEDMKKVLKELKPDVLLTLYGLNSDSGSYTKSATFEGITEFNVNRDILHREISELRVFKTNHELEVMRYVNKISSDAHKQVMKRIRPGMTEYQLETMFQFFCAYNGGSRFLVIIVFVVVVEMPRFYIMVFDKLENSIFFTYFNTDLTNLFTGHSSEPNNKTLQENDMCLLDMGAEYFGYAADITCSYPSNGKFSEEQTIIYNAVLDANLEVQKTLKPEVSWTEMHLLAERIILDRLKKAGLLIGSVDEMLENRLGAIFMPHGLGHFIGIDTHDVGGYLEGHPIRSSKPGLKSLRTARIIKERMCITIEPGCYFISALLNKAFEDETLAKFLVKDKIESYMYVGGVRIEDVVYVTATGIELLSHLPRKIEEIESLIEKGKKEDDVHLPQLKQILNC